MVQIIINQWCKKCGICAEFCPKKVFEYREGQKPSIERPEECIECKLCELRCPDYAITIRSDNS